MQPEESTYVLRIGGAAKNDLLAQLARAGVRLNAIAEALFADTRFTVTARPAEVLVQVRSVESLGLPDGGTFEQVLRSAKQEGLSPCPLEVAPNFRLQYIIQPEGAVGQPRTEGRAPARSVTVASMPLDDEDETPKGFYLRRIDGTLWLRGYRSWSGHVWSPTDLVAFVRKENAT